MPLLIGLVGATGSGKSTLANLLVERHGFVRAHMGQPIKDMLLALGLTHDQVMGPPEVRSRPSALLDGQTPRYAMETLGTDWGRRMVSPRLWANAIELKLASMRDDGVSQIVVDDLRFPTDFAVVEQLGGTIVKVVRPGVSSRRTLFDVTAYRLPWTRAVLRMMGLSAVHETEYHWHDVNASFEIENNGSRDDLLASFLETATRRALLA